MTGSPLPLLAQRVLNRPLLIGPDKAELILAALAERFGIARLVVPEAGHGSRERDRAALRALAAAATAGPRPERKIYEAVEGIALIPIEGTLVNRLGCLDPYSGMTGYDGIALKFRAALADPEIRAVWLDIDSPGGEVAGCFDLADEIYAARGTKPVWAVCSETALSAAYALASAADGVIVPRTGTVGSIGVVALHADLSGALEHSGVRVTLIQSGAHKADGHPYAALPEEVRARWQDEIDGLRDLFCRTVARNRGLDLAAVRATEALTYTLGTGVAAGLADAVMAPRQAWTALHDHLNHGDMP